MAHHFSFPQLNKLAKERIRKALLSLIFCEPHILLSGHMFVKKQLWFPQSNRDIRFEFGFFVRYFLLALSCLINCLINRKLAQQCAPQYTSLLHYTASVHICHALINSRLYLEHSQLKSQKSSRHICQEINILIL